MATIGRRQPLDGSGWHGHYDILKEMRLFQRIILLTLSLTSICALFLWTILIYPGGCIQASPSTWTGTDSPNMEILTARHWKQIHGVKSWPILISSLTTVVRKYINFKTFARMERHRKLSHATWCETWYPPPSQPPFSAWEPHISPLSKAQHARIS